MSSTLDINDYTYEHRVIEEAKLIVSSLDETGRIFETKLSPKTIILLQIFSKIEDLPLKELPKSKGASQIMTDFLNVVSQFRESGVTKDRLDKFSEQIVVSLESLEFGQVAIRNFTDVFLLAALFNEVLFIKERHDPNLLREGAITSFIAKLNNSGEDTEIISLLDMMEKFAKGNSVGEISTRPFNDLVLEGIAQLLFARISLKTDDRGYLIKIMLRRLAYIKNLVEKVNLLQELKKNIFKPTEQLIYSILFCGCVLELILYNKSISLNQLEAMEYLDKQVGSNLVKSELHRREKQAVDEALRFSLPDIFEKIGLKFNYKIYLHKVLILYSVLWVAAIFSTILYISGNVDTSYLRPIMILIYLYLIGFSLSIIYQAYKKKIDNDRK
jgi:hypothetical protein